MKTVIIDDEPLSRELLKDYINDTPGLEFQAAFDSALKASAWFSTSYTDILFLDIKMPRMSGIDWLKSQPISQKTHIVLISAFSEYVSESYELAVTDYLLKPISFQRFFSCIERIKCKTDQEKNTKLLIRSEKSWVVLDMASVLYVEGMGDYLKIVTKTQSYVIQETMKEFGSKLSDQDFFRVHKSYFIHRQAVTRIDGNTIPVGKTLIPISLNQKEPFLAWISS